MLPPQVDLEACARHGLRVMRVPACEPHPPRPLPPPAAPSVPLPALRLPPSHPPAAAAAAAPADSPRSVAEHALALTFALARNLHLATQRVASGNYTLSGLVGFEVR